MTRAKRHHPSVTALLAILLVGLAITSHAQTAEQKVLEQIGVDQRLDSVLPLDLKFRDEHGKDVTLGDYFKEKPVVLSLVYYECPMLCTMTLNGLIKAINAMDLEVYRDYDIVTVSFDPGETPALAMQKKETYLDVYRHEGGENGWHFLTGDAEPVRQLAEAVGYRYVYDEETDEYAHASAIMIATPAGKLSKYFYGIEFSARDMRLGLVDASVNRIGSFADKLLLWCYHYDPMTGKYGLAIMNVIRLAGALTVGCMVTFMVAMLRRDKRKSRKRPTAASETTDPANP